MPNLVTLVHKNCRRNCNICNYGAAAPIDYARLGEMVDVLEAHGLLVHLFDFEVTRDTLAMYQRTGQFRRPNPGWINVTASFRVDEEVLAILKRLRANIAISLHGSTAELHRISSGKNDFGSILRFMRRFHDVSGRKLIVNYVVNKKTLSDMQPFLEMCRELPVDYVEFIPMGYTGHAATRLGRDFVLSDEERFEAFCIVLASEDRYPFDVGLDAVWGPDFIVDRHKQCYFFNQPSGTGYCNAGLNHVGLRVEDGQVFPCPCMAGLDDFAMGSFDGQAFVVDRDWRQRYQDLEEPCASCDKLRICFGGCRLYVIVDHLLRTGEFNPQAGYPGCFYRMARAHPGRLREAVPEKYRHLL
ncbi:MAG: SPASM domain-containing protein [Pseudomonadota bacterium]